MPGRNPCALLVLNNISQKPASILIKDALSGTGEFSVPNHKGYHAVKAKSIYKDTVLPSCDISQQGTHPLTASTATMIVHSKALGKADMERTDYQNVNILPGPKSSSFRDRKGTADVT